MTTNAPTEASVVPGRVLLVEDRRLDVELTLDAFRQALPGTRVESVLTGEDALERLEHVDENELPDLILLDLHLPGMSGHEVLRRIKGSRSLHRIPVLILSSSNDAADRASSRADGASGYFLKPRSFGGFLDVVRSIRDSWREWNAFPPRP